MTYGNAVVCRVCNTRTTKLLGFSAPMALPGEDRVDLGNAKVITIQPFEGDLGFYSIYELDAATESQTTAMTYTQDGQHHGTYVPDLRIWI